MGRKQKIKRKYKSTINKKKKKLKNVSTIYSNVKLNVLINGHKKQLFKAIIVFFRCDEILFDLFFV